ncbi:hypothetical protein ACQ4M4_08385 [Leptolyngbya sp. AN02str]|uniref:hypothetical protein n=1 Tax=Leptolyngbya sp. AN02str TaxID=3423363 RepID=UPI003D31A0F1
MKLPEGTYRKTCTGLTDLKGDRISTRSQSASHIGTSLQPNTTSSPFNSKDDLTQKLTN